MGGRLGFVSEIYREERGGKVPLAKKRGASSR